jgi:triphosphoribosyl-dephospho-CoA synthase
VSFVTLSALKALSLGLRLEPLLHPKPGAVTRLMSHTDKSVIDFCVHTLPSEMAMLRGFLASLNGEEDPIYLGLSEYLKVLKSLGITRNIALGSLMLHLPLAVALGNFSFPPEPSELAKAATSAVLSSRMGGKAYYELLRFLKPSHLRRYEGPFVDVSRGDPSSLAEALRAASWDHVHSELLNGYKKSLELLGFIENYHNKADVETRFLHALLFFLAKYGDTLVMEKYGVRAFQRSLDDARWALAYSAKVGIKEVLEILDNLWRGRGWNPGASLDVLSVSISLYYYNILRKKVLV